MATPSNDVIAERISNLQKSVEDGFSDIKNNTVGFENRLRAVETFVAGIDRADRGQATGQDWVKIILAILGVGSILLGVVQNFIGKH